MHRNFVSAGLVAAIGVSLTGLVQADAGGIKHIQDVTGMELTAFESPGNNTFLDDVVTSGNEDAPITCGMFRIEQGEPLEYGYPYDEALLMVEGEMQLSDGETAVTARPGDVLFIPKGANVTFSADDYGLSFFCGQREG